MWYIVIMKIKLLFVDDDIQLLESLNLYFTRLGYDTTVVDCGSKALEILENETFNCIILDITMSDIDGIAVCKKVRSASNTPIIFITSLEEERTVVLGFEVGADDYIRKPFSLLELEARIKARIKNINSSELIFGGLCIDKARKRVYYNGEMLCITSLEFEILLYLAENLEKSFTKEQLFEQIWNQPALGNIHTVQSHIFSLRKKLLHLTGINYITTQWGKGYSFVPDYT